MVRPLLIVVSGAPGAGKTTLGRRIARELHLPIVTKDDIKESLFESLGWRDRAWSRQLGLASLELLYYFAEAQLAAGRSFIMESNFRPELANERFLQMKSRHDFVPLQILCRADRNVLLERCRERDASGERHPGHIGHSDYEEVYEELKPLLRNELYGALDIGGRVIEIDTNDFSTIDYARLLEEITGVSDDGDIDISSGHSTDGGNL